MVFGLALIKAFFKNLLKIFIHASPYLITETLCNGLITVRPSRTYTCKSNGSPELG